MLLHISSIVSWLPTPLDFICVGVVAILLFVVLARVIITIIDVVSSVVAGIKGLLLGLFGGV